MWCETMPQPKSSFRLIFLVIASLLASAAFAFFRPQPRRELQLLSSADFTCADIARAVNYYVELGEEKTLREFHDLISRHDSIGRPDMDERIGWLCRILYVPNGQPLRPPGLGGLTPPQDQMPLDRWPIYPVVQSGDTYCVLAEGHLLLGLPERMPDYFRYCSSMGSFRTEPVAVPDRSTAIRDVSAIRSSDRWSTIKWTNDGKGGSYTISEPWIWSAVITQAESIRD